MAANNISQLTTANTFQHWLDATSYLIATANLLTDGSGDTFYANTILEIGGVGASLNVVTAATINVLTSNTITTKNLYVTENISRVNVSSDLHVGTDAYIYGTLDADGDTTLNGELDVAGNVTISGDLTVTGNITLDSIGFDDLIVSGSGSFGNTLSVTGNTSLSNVSVANTLNANVALITTANITNLNVASANITTLVGTANTAIYDAIRAAEGTSLAFSIALG